jgi:ParB/RepB/Spo0J family partition protein
MIVELSRLRSSPFNSRTTYDPKDLKELANSIEHLGLILPIAVRTLPDTDVLEVIDGHRRVEAIRILIDSGKHGGLVDVNVIDADDARVRQQSLAANIERLPLHPVDQYEAFAAIATDGTDLGTIGRRFGLSKKQVAQVLGLGKLSDKVRKAWRDGVIDEEIARVFTRGSVEEQDEVLAGLGKQLKHANKWVIEREFGERKENAAKWIAVVGRKEYEARGGTVIEDLFEPSLQWVSDRDLLNRMLTDQVNFLKADIAELGYGTVEFTTEYVDRGKFEWAGRGNPGVEGGTLKALGAVAKKRRAECSVFVKRSHDGSLYIDGPWIPKQKPKAKKLTAPGEGGETERVGSELSGALRSEVIGWRTKAYQTCFASTPHAFLRLAIAAAHSAYCTAFRWKREMADGHWQNSIPQDKPEICLAYLSDLYRESIDTAGASDNDMASPRQPAARGCAQARPLRGLRLRAVLHPRAGGDRQPPSIRR